MKAKPRPRRTKRQKIRGQLRRERRRVALRALAGRSFAPGADPVEHRLQPVIEAMIAMLPYGRRRLLYRRAQERGRVKCSVLWVEPNFAYVLTAPGLPDHVVASNKLRAPSP